MHLNNQYVLSNIRFIILKTPFNNQGKKLLTKTLNKIYPSILNDIR